MPDLSGPKRLRASDQREETNDEVLPLTHLTLEESSRYSVQFPVESALDGARSEFDENGLIRRKNWFRLAAFRD